MAVRKTENGKRKTKRLFPSAVHRLLCTVNHTRAFTLIEMLIAILLTAMVFTYLYATLDTVRGDRKRYEHSVARTLHAQRIYDLLSMDLTQMRSRATIVHEAGFDRIAFTTDHSLYGIPRPWVHWYVSSNGNALIRIESTGPIDFMRSDYIGDAKGTYFFSDLLGNDCSSLRFTDNGERIDFMVRCRDADAIVASLYKGDE
ncbi:prepilin-type N-terminal cleavage/methylation domain-containing protein [Hydrogenimonas sp. SS33]|uniref:PulJ/GspJ family protein n=1 Tax=Hydrogenimonas leucolamina TaxID=2954236 RepID=UPI00336C0F7D